MMRRAIAASLLLGLALQTAGCENEAMLQAKKIDSQRDLIGGPAAKSKLGDYLIENDQIRATIGGPGPGFSAGVFGGTLLDVDRHRWQTEYQDGHGWDQFSESFPLANLLIANPADPSQVLTLTVKDKMTVDPDADAATPIEVISDGSDGKEAKIRVQGHSAYIFDVLKYLNRGFFDGLTISLGSIASSLGSFGAAIPGMLGTDTLDLEQLEALLSSPNIIEGIKGAKPDLGPALDFLTKINIFGLLNRLQINFDFTTEYTLHPGESFLTITTTVRLAPPSQKLLGGCTPVLCDKKCPNGFVMVEQDVPREWALPAGDPLQYTYKQMCPVCECGKALADMPTFNESRDFFTVLLGTPDSWTDPQWKGGVVAGDFLFYGGNAAVFGPGFGFDITRKIYEDMWQGVGTLGSPFALDWLAATGENVSYSWVTANPNERHAFDCPAYRLAVVHVDPAAEDAVAKALKDQYPISEGDASARARQAVVDHKPILPPLPEIPIPDAAGRPAFDAWVTQVLAGDAANDLRAKLGDGVTVALIPRHECMPSKLLVPLFSTSATAVLTNFSEGDRLVKADDGTIRDENRSYTYKRYMAVGDGDVASVLRTVYDLRGTAHGEVAGTVFEQGSIRPIQHASVFVVSDWRVPCDKDAGGKACAAGFCGPWDGGCLPAPATFQAYRALTQDALGTSGFVSQMQTDLGLDPVIDGGFSGPVPPGRYFAIAHHRDRGSSPLAPFEVLEGQTTTVNLGLPAAGTIDYSLQDDGGQGIPARLSLIATDASGLRYDWDGINDPEMNDPTYDHGIYKQEFSTNGTGTIKVPPGHYDILASHGIEFGLGTKTGFEVGAGQHKTLKLMLPREVDTTGYIAGDFHVHAGNSTDSGLNLTTRVKAAAAEGLEFFTSTDHDVETDYGPLVKKLGLEHWLKTEVGTETSPLEYGHYNGYPEVYDDTKWTIHDPASWPGKTLADIWQAMRDRASAGPDEYVLQVNHPRDGFMGFWAQIGMKSYNLERKTPGMEMCNKVMEAAPCTFDAFELMNGKNFQYLHTPTVGESYVHNKCYSAIKAARDVAKFPLNGTAGTDVICGDLQAGPDCTTETAAAAGLTGGTEAEITKILDRDHCLWRKEFRRDVTAACTCHKVPCLTPDNCACTAGATLDSGTTCQCPSLLDCKRGAMEALKLMSVRYQMERTPEENNGFWATTTETDIGSDYTKAMAGCTAVTDGSAGCGGDEKCVCKACVCALLPDCCTAGGVGWTQVCADACRGECHGCENRPCTDRIEPIEDWFAFLDAGFDKTVVANSDSHSLVNEIGLPRNYVASATDTVQAIRPSDVHRAIHAGKIVLSSGPMVEFQLFSEDGHQAGIGETLDASGGGKIRAHLKVQTASWFKVDRIEIYRNSKLEQRRFPNQPIQAVVDFDNDIDLGRPLVDSWYVVLAYGINDGGQMSPVYKRHPYGEMLISTLISLGATQILASFGSLLDKIPKTLFDASSLLGSLELPDSFPVFPFATTNPIRVDIDGGGFKPAKAKLAADGTVALPGFCTRPCAPVAGDDGKPTQGICGLNQVCVPSADGKTGACAEPIPSNCVGMQNIGQQ